MAETVICVATVVKNGERILLARQAKGHRMAGTWTVPWGRLESGESPVSAAIRETREEGGVTAAVEGLLGVQELPAPWDGWIALAYLCRHVEGDPAPDGRETDAARYFSLAELNALREPVEPWSDWLVRRAFAGDVAVVHSSPANPRQPHGSFI
jgi:8-oxo-dGTP diphosphatase